MLLYLDVTELLVDRLEAVLTRTVISQFESVSVIRGATSLNYRSVSGLDPKNSFYLCYKFSSLNGK